MKKTITLNIDRNNDDTNLHSIEENKEKDNNLLENTVIFKEECNDTKYPGESKNKENSDIYKEVCFASILHKEAS